MSQTLLGDGNVTASGVVRGDTVRAASFEKYEIGTTTKTSDLATALAAKADKVASATSGNFAGLDGNGNLTDSGKKASDFDVSGAATSAVSTHDGLSTAHSTQFAAKQDKVYTLTQTTFTPTTATLTGGGATIECNIEYSDLEFSDGDWSCTALFSNDDLGIMVEQTFATSDGEHSASETSIDFGSQSVSFMHGEPSVEYTGTIALTATRAPAYCGAEADVTPTDGSNKLVTSGGVYDAVDGKQDALTEGTGITISGNNTISTDAVRTFAAVGGQTPTVTSGEADLSTLFSSDNTLLMGVCRYGIGTTSSVTMADRTTNVYTLNDSSGTAVTLVFPSLVSGKMRDFLLVLTYTAGSLELPSGVTKVGDTLSFTAGKTYLIAFTEISANNFYVRSIQLD